MPATLADRAAVASTEVGDRCAPPGAASAAVEQHAVYLQAAGPAPGSVALGLKVVLLNLPWASYRRPSIQLGLLGALAERLGCEVQIAHLNLDLAAQFGLTNYEVVSEHRSIALGEWLFARAAFGDEAPAPEPFLAQYGDALRQLLTRRQSPLDLDDLLRFREEGAERFLRAQLQPAAWADTDLFGLSSTFQQNNACFAMARLLKDAWPACRVVAGGANFDADMGLEWLRCVPALDVVVSGEADVAFPMLLRALAQGRSLDSVPNLVLRGAPAGTAADPPATRVVRRTLSMPPFRALDDLPTPDYRDYFDRAERLALLDTAARRNVDLPVETSRGCWWGERRHCTFCGLNGQTMAYRSKTATRVAEELADLAARYRSFRFTAVDNILDLQFHKTLFPELVAQKRSYDLFFEVKSGVSPAHLRELHAAGIRRIQPGVESLSTHVLQLMNKGVGALANVNLLRGSRQWGLDVSWNLIWGFPGETQDDYDTQLAWLVRLSHLQPPTGAGRIWLERFSPLYQQRAASDVPLQPERSLQYVYPPGVDLRQAAYFFEYDFASTVDPEVWQATTDFVEQWQAAHREPSPPRLEYRYSPGFLQIDDARLAHTPGIYTFGSPYAELYMALIDTPRPVDSLHGVAGGVDAETVQRFLAEFGAAGLLLVDGASALALALPATPERRAS